MMTSEPNQMQVAAIVSAVPVAPTMPSIYATYVDEKCWQVLDNKRSPNKEFIAHLIAAIVARFRKRYPNIAAGFTVSIATAGQIQILMLMRILCVSALLNKFNSIEFGTIDDLRRTFNMASVEHDAWAWFAGVFGPEEKTSSMHTMTVPDEIIPIAEKVVITEVVALSLPGFRDGNYSDRVVQCLLAVIVDCFSLRVFEFWSAMVELESKTSLKLSSSDVNGVMRLFNHARIPAQSQFFTELGQFGNSFEAIKRDIKARDKKAKDARKLAA